MALLDQLQHQRQIIGETAVRHGAVRLRLFGSVARGEERTDSNTAVAPDAADWLTLDEQERLYFVEAYHRRAGILLPTPTGHAAWHVAVENQIAADDPPATQRALTRLIAEGLDRHQAIHAIAWVLTDLLQQSLAASTDFSNVAYEVALDALTESVWRAACQDDEGD